MPEHPLCWTVPMSQLQARGSWLPEDNLPDPEEPDVDEEADIEEDEERAFWMDGDDDHRAFGRAVYGYE